MAYCSSAKNEWSWRFKIILWLTILLNCMTVESFHDSIFDFVSFEDVREWDQVYGQTCSRNRFDAFREPRLKTKPDDLRAPIEANSPIVIDPYKTRKSEDNYTLHIYNNPGVANSYSVSYGFQRNKECLHGQDKNCIVYRSFGKVRALVVNAERFKKGQPLNYIKDHFLIEEPEKFVTILNGGSVHERKFYEAVFLGGYIPKGHENRGQSSHRVNKTTYPLEIYMYFVDETIPSMSLTTILVVLVKESKKDNQYVMPILNTIDQQLYDKERNSIRKHEYRYRKAQMFHNLQESIKYDLEKKEIKHENSKESVSQERSSQSWYSEGSVATSMEAFEKMQGLETQLNILDEENALAKEIIEKSDKFINNIYLREKVVKTDPLPILQDELYMLLMISTATIISRGKGGKKQSEVDTYNEPGTNTLSCDRAYGIVYDLAQKTPADNPELKSQTVHLLHEYYETGPGTKASNHDAEFRKLFKKICKFMWDYTQWRTDNDDIKIMATIPQQEKYQNIKAYQHFAGKIKKLNDEVYQHFFGDDSFHVNISRFQTELKSEYKSGSESTYKQDDATPKFHKDEDKFNFVDAIIQYYIVFEKSRHFVTVEERIAQAIAKLAEAHNFDGDKTMRDVLHYHKYGYKNLDLKKRRSYIHNAFLKGFLPNQLKRRGHAELGGIEEKDDEIESTEAESPEKIIIPQKFQISWLIPPYGGYYHYHGSSPVPPCFRAQNVIVFKEPITMSKKQIQKLTRVPIDFNREHDITYTTPVLHDVSFRVDLRGDKDSNSNYKHVRYEEVVVPIYNETRNHLFLGHDQVHKNAVEMYEERKERDKAGNNSAIITKPRFSTQAILLPTMIGYFNLIN